MDSTPSLAAGQPGTFALRAKPRWRPPPDKPAVPRRLGYRFDPIPAFVPALVHARRLCASDVIVLGHLLRFRPRDKDSCWSCKSVIAAATGVSARTVQRSFDRLSAAGVVEQRHVGYPDLEDAKNRTGWRITFRWLTAEDYVPGPGPARVGKGVPKGSGSRRGGDTVSPHEPCLGETNLSPPRETSVSPNSRAVFAGAELNSDRIYPDGKIQTPSSSSAPTDDDDDQSSFPSGGEPEEGTPEAAAEAAAECKWPELAEAIKADAARTGRKIGGQWKAFTAAVYGAHLSRKGKAPDTIGYFVKTVGDYAKDGVSAEALLHGDKLRERRRRFLEMAEEAEREEAERKAEAEAVLREAEGLGWRFVLPAADGLLRPYATTADAPKIEGELGEKITKHKPAILTILAARPPLTDAERAALQETSRAWHERVKADVEAAHKKARERNERFEAARKATRGLTYAQFLKAEAAPEPEPEAASRVGPCPPRGQSPAQPDTEGGGA